MEYRRRGGGSGFEQRGRGRSGGFNGRSGGRGGGRSFTPNSKEGFSRAHDSSYTARYDNASGVSLDADPIVDRQKDRKERRRQERQQKKQFRIDMHAQIAEQRRLAREQSRERKAATQLELQRKRERTERAAAKVQRSARKAQKTEANTDATTKKKRTTAASASPAVGVKATAGKGTAVPKSTKNGKTGASLNLSALASLLPPADAAAATASASAPSLSSFLVQPTDTTAVPTEVAEKVRRLVNKLTMTNVADLTKDLSEYMSTAGVSRAAIMKGLAQQIERLCLLETGPMNTTGTLPFAGLLRGIQLLHGNQVGAELVERVSFALRAQLAAGEEAAAGNTLMVLAQLYLLYGVDVVFVMSLLRMLLHQGTRILDAEGSATSASATQATCAAACGLALMRACGEKLLKESPTELGASLQAARRASAQMRNVTGSARFSALVEVMSDIAAGRTRKARRTVSEDAAPVEAMLEDLCALLPGQEKATATQRRTMKRLVLSTNTLSSLTWDQVTAIDKPPRWYIPGVMSTVATAAKGSDTSTAASLSGASGQDGSSSSLFGSDESDSTSDKEEEELDEAELKRERIARMRVEEKAINGQRLNTEHKREIFKCVASATDDLECFTMLVHRDPGYTRFHDVCAVLLQCVYQEKQYNPYYVQVLMRFCSAKPACVKTLQFAIWDRFKSIRIEGTDVAGYFNLSCCIADLLQNGVYNLSLLRGLDLENTNKTIGLFTRVLLLRLIFQLPGARLTQLFFGGDGRSAHDLLVDTSALRGLLVKFMANYFVDENVTKRWLPSFYDAVASGTSFDTMQAKSASARDHDTVMAEAEARLLQRNADRPTSTLSANAATPSAAYDTAAASTPPTPMTSPEALLAQFMKRVRVVYKALKQGIS